MPAGIHRATWEEVEQVFGTTNHRVRLLDGLYEAMVQLKIAGCRRIYVNGSFVTAEPHPADFDACWDPVGVDPYLLDPILLDCRPPRHAQKARYHGELVPSSATAAVGYSYLQYFQVDKNSGDPKGIVAMDLAMFTIKQSTP